METLIFLWPGLRTTMWFVMGTVLPRNRRRFWIITIALLAPGFMPLRAAPCVELLKLKLHSGKITDAQTWAPNRPPATTAAVCKVAVTLTPTPDSDIKVELWLPEANWNGKYMAVGNGGWSGSINYRGLEDGVRRGYASSSTDTGHVGGSASFALGHPEKLIDYAYRSEHEMAVQAKAIIAAYYGRQARFAYWNGCSAGGKQGLKEAQQYPADFDGIVAGSPASNWTGRAVQAIWSAQAVHRDEASYIPPQKYPYLHNAVLAACDALDGVADGVLENPKSCNFDPGAMECKGADSPHCLMAPQVAAARQLYSDSINPRTGQHLYPGLQHGSELGWATWAGINPLGIALDYFRYVVFQNPAWNYRSLNFDSDIARVEALDSHRINATDPNLKPYFDHGGKLIQYHGWSDPQISPGNSTAYYRSVVDKVGPSADSSYRLFMVPGMGHCGGGEGTDSFDALQALETWVEQKKAPASIPAARIRTGKVERTRPLCPFPQVAVYQGHGSTDEQANFACKVLAQ